MEYSRWRSCLPLSRSTHATFKRSLTKPDHNRRMWAGKCATYLVGVSSGLLYKAYNYIVTLGAVISACSAIQRLNYAWHVPTLELTNGSLPLPCKRPGPDWFHPYACMLMRPGIGRKRVLRIKWHIACIIIGRCGSLVFHAICNTTGLIRRLSFATLQIN